MGEIRNPSDPASYGLDPKTATLRLKFRVQRTDVSPMAISNGDASGATLSSWDAVLWKGRLYVAVTASTMCHGSKEAFVSLLEYAEDVLECTHVVVCLGKPGTDKTISDRETQMAIRNFMFLGFQPLAPGHEFMPSNPNLVCFVYTT